ncbi:MAG: GYD domain-containing protein [Aquificae bacterium]|nr:GYD domain-containing protein [Aquificota bacterium]
MPIYVMLTKVSPDATKNPFDLVELEKEVKASIKRNCPDVKWIKNLAVFGPYDYLDIFEAPNDEEASKVAIIVRSFGHATTETWSAIEWDNFKDTIAHIRKAPIE